MAIIRNLLYYECPYPFVVKSRDIAMAVVDSGAQCGEDCGSRFT